MFESFSAGAGIWRHFFFGAKSRHSLMACSPAVNDRLVGLHSRCGVSGVYVGAKAADIVGFFREIEIVGEAERRGAWRFLGVTLG